MRLKVPLFALLLLSTVGTGRVWAQSVGTFVPSGNMTTPRSGHTATLLHDGRVLIVGGSRDRPASAEIYDPRTGTFSATGDLTMIRTGPTATLLPDGKVLIVGGDRFSGNAPSKSTAELYNPSTGSFSPTGDLVAVQIGGTATLLHTGKVLIAGGVTSQSQCCTPATAATPELYDPSTGTFTLTGTFKGTGDAFYVKGGPNNPSATLLLDGRVLIAGEPESELYDPVTGTFTLAGAMTTPCFGGPPMYIGGRTATLLKNGKVLLTGGEHEDCGRFANSELYDPATGAFTATGNMTRARDNHTATLLSTGLVLIAGGESDSCSAVGCFFSGTDASIEFYDPSTGTFTAGGTMTARRAGHAAIGLSSGAVLITGGYSFAGIGSFSCCFASTELYGGSGLTAPVPVFPLDAVVTDDMHPRLQIHNASVSNGIVGNVTYRFEFSTKPWFPQDSFTGFRDAVPQGAGGETAYDVTDTLAPGTLHYWHARAELTLLNGQHPVTVSEYSQTQSFRTPAFSLMSRNPPPALATPSAAGGASTETGTAVRPSDLIATASGSGVVLTWIAPTGVTPGRYAISGGNTPHTSTLPVIVTPDASTQYTISALPSGRYYFTVSAILNGGLTGPSNEADVAVTGSTSATSAPSGALAVSDGDEFTITWTPGPEGAVVYYVEIGRSPGHADVATLTATQPSATYDADRATTYYLRVRGARGATVSAPSNEVSVSVASAMCTDAPFDPILLPVSTADAKTTISWLPPGGPRVDNYRIDATGPSGSMTMSSRGNGTSFTAHLEPGAYAIRVTATNACGASAASNQITFTQPDQATSSAK